MPIETITKINGEYTPEIIRSIAAGLSLGDEISNEITRIILQNPEYQIRLENVNRDIEHVSGVMNIFDRTDYAIKGLVLFPVGAIAGIEGKFENENNYDLTLFVNTKDLTFCESIVEQFFPVTSKHALTRINKQGRIFAFMDVYNEKRDYYGNVEIADIRGNKQAKELMNIYLKQFTKKFT